MNTPQKTNMDTQHDGLEKKTSFKEHCLYQISGLYTMTQTLHIENIYSTYIYHKF